MKEMLKDRVEELEKKLQEHSRALTECGNKNNMPRIERVYRQIEAQYLFNKGLYEKFFGDKK